MMAKRSWPQSYSRLEWSRFLVCVLSALIVEACADPSLSKLRLASWLPPSHVLVRDILVPWAERVRVATEGRVEIEVMGAPLGQPSVSFDIARDGLADIAYRVLSFIIIDPAGMVPLVALRGTKRPGSARAGPLPRSDDQWAAELDNAIAEGSQQSTRSD